MGWYEFLPRLLNMSLTASLIILAVLIIRMLLKRAPKMFSYALWAVVLFRLLCPVSCTSQWSLLQWLDVPVAEDGTLEYIPADIVHTEYPEVSLPQVEPVTGKEGMGISEEKESVGDAGSDTMSGTKAVGGLNTEAATEISPIGKLEGAINERLPQREEQLAADPLEVPITLGTYIWGLGAMGLFLYNMVQMSRLRHKLRVAEPLCGNIYLADYIDTPFVMGLVRPKIYLPSTLKVGERRYIIMHEQYHIRRWDHVVKVLIFVALCIHWFNPLVWIAFSLVTKDMEMSCDEAVMKQMEEDIRAEYAQSLLQLATGRRNFEGVTLAFGEGDTKARVKNVMHYRKPAFWVIVTALVVCVATVILLLANPKQEQELLTPFGKGYKCSSISYDGSGYGNYIKEIRKYGASYYLTEDKHLMAKGQVQIQKSFEEWKDLGQLKEVKLTDDNYDRLFYTNYSGYKIQYVDTIMSKAAERHKIYKAWQIISDEVDHAYNYYLLQTEDNELQLACWQTDKSNEEYSIMKWIVPLEENVEVQLLEEESEETLPLIGETYRSSERLATAFDTDVWLLDGDSGYLYEIEEDTFVIINKVDGSETRIPVEKWEWQELPFTDEEWKQIADRSVSLQDIRNRFGDVKYQPLGENASLLLLNDMMVFAEYGEFREYDFYMGDAFTLVPVESNVETAVIERIYEAEYKDSPQAAYPAQDWFSEEGGVEYPADSLILKEDSTLTERFVRFYMPREVLNEAETVELLRLSAQWPMSRYSLYNYMCYYLDFLTLKFNGADELIHRPDLAEAVFAEYQTDSFLPLRDLPNAKEQSEYNKLCYAQMDKIALEEILLASNRAFDQMDEDMKQAVLEEVLQKVEQRQSGRFKCSNTESNTVSEFPSGFFSYILEQKEAGGSKWYQYLVETGETELVEKLDSLSPYTCRP